MPSVTASGQRRAVAELNATIGRVEEQRREQLAAASRLAAAGRDPAPLRALGLPAPELGHPAPGGGAGGAPLRRGELPREAPRPGAPPAAVAVRAGLTAPSRALPSSLSRPSWPARRRPGPPPPCPGRSRGSAGSARAAARG